MLEREVRAPRLQSDAEEQGAWRNPARGIHVSPVSDRPHLPHSSFRVMGAQSGCLREQGKK